LGLACQRLTAFFAEEAAWSCMMASPDSSTLLSSLSPSPLPSLPLNSETWARGEGKKWERGEPVEKMKEGK
jgi:hypothetical protein